MEQTTNNVLHFILVILCLTFNTTEAVNNYVRIRGGRSLTSGPVEVKVAGAWGQICSTNWSMKDATVVCRQIGFDGPKKNTHGIVLQHSHRRLEMSNVKCNGNETNIFDCRSITNQTMINCRSKSVATVACVAPVQRPPQDKSPCKSNQFLCMEKNMCIPVTWRCNHKNDCGDNQDEINCTPNLNLISNTRTSIRLVGKDTTNDGRLEVKYDGLWGTVCNDGFRQPTANVACKQLGFQGALRIYRNSSSLATGRIWLDNVRCLGNESSIYECRSNPLGTHDCIHSEDVWIKCKPQTGCGVQQFPIVEASHRIVGGQPATRGSWPWQASLLITFPSGDESPFCGGVLVANQWVLTAAHCFDNMKQISLSGIKVRLGEHNMPLQEGTEQDFSIRQLVKHSLYRKDSHLADIALIKLNRPANTASRYVQTICLPDNGIKPFNGSDYCYVTGWGDTRGTGDKNILQQAKVPIYTYYDCRKMYGRKLYPGMLCAGYDMGAKDACQGDSGGPLMCKRDGRWMVAGIVSWGEGCGEMNKPGVYTEVTTYLSWIQKTIDPTSISISSEAFGR